MNINFENYKKIVEEVFNPFYGLDEADNLSSKRLNESSVKYLAKGTPYMLRNDGRVFECGSVHPYIWKINRAEDLGGTVDSSLFWYYNCTQYEEIKNFIKYFLSSLYYSNKLHNSEREEILKFFPEVEDYPHTDREDEMVDIQHNIINEMEQEFLRFRTGDLYFGNKGNGIYFRVSSTNFNWFPLIEKIVLDNKFMIDTITITRDENSKQVYKHKGVEFNRLPIEEFISLPGNPIVENANISVESELAKGKPFFDVFEGIGFHNANERIAKLKKEYIIENFVLKEEYLKPQTPYMLRNDGKLISVKPIHPYIWYNIYQSEKEGIERLINKDIGYLRWFYDNTQYSEVKEAIEVFLSSLLDVDYYNINKDNITNTFDDLYELDYIETEFNLNEMFKYLNDSMNQEFCRVRTSHMKFNVGNSGDIYFRIGSTNFDWFTLIYKLISENRHFITTVSICTDSQSLGGIPRFLKLGREVINQMPVEEFLSISGSPIFEEYEYNSPSYLLNQGKSLLEAFDGYYFGHVHNLYESFRSEYVEKNFPMNHSEIDILENTDSNLNETIFKSKTNKLTHWMGHVNWFNDEEEDDELFPSMSPDEYDRAADKLSREKVNTSDPNSPDDIVGYFGNDGRIVKYKKSTGEIVVYKNKYPDQTTIAYYKTKENDPASYLRKKRNGYGRELTPRDDDFNH